MQTPGIQDSVNTTQHYLVVSKIKYKKKHTFTVKWINVPTPSYSNHKLPRIFMGFHVMHPNKAVHSSEEEAKKTTNVLHLFVHASLSTPLN